MPKKSWILAAALLSLRAFCSVAEDPGPRYTIRSWGTREGLPANEVISLIQTRDGYLWLGTYYGLVRFDGIHFTTFDQESATGLNSAVIVQLFEDSRGGLWVGTGNTGIKLIQDGRIVSVPPEPGFDGGPLKSVCEDADGGVWLYTASGSMIRYRDGKGVIGNSLEGGSNHRFIIAEKSGALWRGTDRGLFTSGSTPARDLKSPPSQPVADVNNLNYLLASRRGGFWCLAGGHVQKWSGGRLDRDWGQYPWNPAFIVNAACEDAEGNLIVGTGGDGVWWFNAEGHATQISDRQGLSHTTVLSLCFDREGSLWVGTDGGGLDRVKRTAFDVVPDSRGKTVRSVCDDGQGGVTLSLYYGGFRSWRDKTWQELGSGETLPRLAMPLLNVYGGPVLVDRDQTLWGGIKASQGGLVIPYLLQQPTNGAFRFAPKTWTPYVDASVFYLDRSNRVWVGGAQATLACWNGHDWKRYTAEDGWLAGSATTVKALAEDGDGALWIGTGGDGLYCLKNGWFTSFHRKDGLPNEDISALLADGQGRLWIGTKGGGLVRYHAGQWTQYTTEDGLVSNIIGYLLEDGQDSLWLGSNLGLMRAQKSALNDFAANAKPFSCRVYHEQDGLPTGECSFDTQPAACRTPDGRLWFTTTRGLVTVDPAQLRQNTNPPPVVIEAVLIDDRPQNTNGIRARLPDKINVPAGSEHLEIQFTGLNLSAADQSRFKYLMQGHETNWNQVSRAEAGSRLVARYSKLPPGDYHFEVTACNEDNVWNDTPASLAITVLPPFWRQWWFISASLLALLGIIVGVVHYISTQKLQRQLAGLRQQQALEKERARIARDIHDQLGASLTQVSLLGEMVESDKDSPGDVEDHAKQISRTARDTARVLDEIVWTVNPSNDTLDGLVNYICKYAQEYLAVAGLRYRLDVPAELPGAVISPEVRHNVFLAAKEAVTNVVRHARATSVFVRLRLEPAAFTLEIQDDGRAAVDFEALKASSRNGLRNMSKRMEDIGGRFDMSAAPEGGTIVRLTVPIKKT
jgi:signal transduction histidine kinase/ligand-binding sensor domain-containing protein